MILFLHNRYRTTGGEERTVEQLLRLVREQLGEEAELLARDSAHLPQLEAARGLLRGGLDSRDVAAAVRESGARVVHAHNLQPTLGWRALAAARAEGARVVLHLHQYRLVCAVGVCFTEGRECTRCHGRNTLPGIVHNCRGGRAQALAYGGGLALWQRRIAAQADAVIVPSVFARERLRELGAPLPWERVRVIAPPVWGPGEYAVQPPRGSTRQFSIAADRPDPGQRTPAPPYALVVSRLSSEKGIDVAIEACRVAGIALVVAGDGPERARLEGRALDGEVRFVGRVDDARLAELRAGAALAVVPSRSAETFGLAAAEAMAAGLPVAASRIGALPELVDERGLAAPGDAADLARAIERVRGHVGASARARERVSAVCAPEVVARELAEVYDVD
jgi:glycosyltransferase involved in cell wall biosynthesis